MRKYNIIYACKKSMDFPTPMCMKLPLFNGIICKSLILNFTQIG